MLFAFGAAVSAVGFVVLSPSLRTSGRSAWLPALASGWILLGTAAWLCSAHQRTANPEAYYQDNVSVPWTAWPYLVLTALALLIFGDLMLQSGHTRWIASITLIVIGLLTGESAFVPDRLPSRLTYFLTLLIGVVTILRP